MLFDYRMAIALICVLVVILITLVLILVMDLPQQDWMRVRQEDNDDEGCEYVHVFMSDPTVHTFSR